MGDLLMAFQVRLTRKDLHEWFTSQKGALQNGVQKVVSYPDVNLLNNMGYYIREEFDNTSYLLQFYYDNETDDIIIAAIHFNSTARGNSGFEDID